MHRSRARYSAPVSFVQAPSWADFITTMVGFEVFGTHSRFWRKADIRPPLEKPKKPILAAQYGRGQHRRASAAPICAKLFLVGQTSGEDCEATRIYRTRQQRGGNPTARRACRSPARAHPLFHILGRLSA